MARMIPVTPEAGTKSTAEIRLFKRLQQMPGTEDWTVIHSLRLSRHVSQSEGEADFVVIIPDGGIFTLEVKGGRIEYNGEWFSIDRNNVKNKIKNPINEAKDAMYSIIEYIKENDQSGMNLSYCQCGSGIVFPDTTIHGQLTIPDIDDKQIADIDDMQDIKSYLLRLVSFSKSRRTAQNIFTPNVEKANAIVQLLRPSQTTHISLASQIRSAENRAITLTDNQQDVFDGLLDNERCLIRGSAGTGKTVLALNYAMHLLSNGNRVAFFCYNKRLAEYLANSLSEYKDLLVCDSFTEYMEKLAWPHMPEDVKKQKTLNRNQYYCETLPMIFEEVFLENGTEPFDTLIVDEAQDLIDDHFLSVVDLFIKDGLRDGHWYFFMDAEKQNLYHSRMTYDDVIEKLKSYKTYFTKYLLTDNCRNTKAIIEMVDRIFGTKTKYRPTENTEADVSIQYYRKDKNQLDKLNKILAELLNDGVKPQDIVILSTLRMENSIVSEIADRLTEREGQLDKFYFSTIHGFKGLESPVIILTDIDNVGYDARKNLLYVGMTRARSALYILASDRVKQQLDEMMEDNCL